MAKYLIRKCAAVVAAFSLPVCIASMVTVDKHDTHLQDVTERVELHKAALQTERENEAQWAAQEERIARGDYGEVFEP